MYSPQKIRSASRGRKVSTTSPEPAVSLLKRLSGANQVQGPKITGIGTGSVAADHTLTLIFDSDEEMGSGQDSSAAHQGQNNN